MAEREEFAFLQAERGLAGSVLLDTNAQFWPKARELVTSGDIQNESCRRVWAAACKLLDEDRAVDTLTVLAQAGISHQEAMAMMDITPTAANVCAYAELVRQASLRRQSAEIGMALTALPNGADPLEGISAAQTSLDSLVTGGIRSGALDAGQLGCALIEYREASKEKRLSTGIPGLDEIISGFFPGRFYIFAARPGEGKSAFALALARLAAKEHQVLYVSLEMSEAELSSRIVSSFSGVPYTEILCGRYLDDERETKIAEGLSSQNKLKLITVCRSHVTAEQVAVWARQYKAELVIVDYLQLMDCGNPQELEYQRITELSTALKRMAGTLKVPVLALAQLNRAAAEETPSLHHLKGSGSLEQDADVVALLHRPQSEAPRRRSSSLSVEPFEVEIAKNRHGRTDLLKLNFKAATNRFGEKARR